MMLHHLQTRGGLALRDLTGCSWSGPVHEDVTEIHRLAGVLAADRRGAPARAARRLTADRVPGRVLDIGAGLAPWSLAIAAASRDVHVLAVDLPEQLAALTEAVAAAEVSAQFKTMAADVFTSDLRTAAGYDLVIVANVCHLFPASRTRSLLIRAAGVLAPGGVLAVIDQVLDDPPDWLQWAVLYAVGLPHVMPGGYLHTVDEYVTWMADAGLAAGLADPLSAPPGLSLVSARRES
jgi:SAM-dependent methyltransferase